MTCSSSWKTSSWYPEGPRWRFTKIASGAFRGLPRVRQHQLVYAALKGGMGGELHALALETTPKED